MDGEDDHDPVVLCPVRWVQAVQQWAGWHANRVYALDLIQ
jgi:hypothetical protein